MALSFPLVMPANGVDSMSFQLSRRDLMSPELGGAVGGVTLGFPRWRMTVTLANADSDELDEWQAFVDALRGPQRPFLARDLTRPYGKAYPQGYAGMTRATGGAFDGTAGGWSVLGDRSLFNINSLPAGLIVSKRDYVVLRWDTAGEPRRSLHRYCEAGAANGSGNFLNRSIEPPVPTFVPPTAVASLAGADCVMKLMPEGTQIGETDALHTAGGTVVAIQQVLA